MTIFIYLIFFSVEASHRVDIENRFLAFRPSNSDECKKTWQPGTRCVYTKYRKKGPVELKIEKCEAGSISNTQITFDKTRCNWCAPGEWQADEGQSSCFGSPCSPGTYDSSKPEVEGICKPCPEHHYSNHDVGTYKCDICIGTTSNQKSDGCLNHKWIYIS